MTAAATAAPRRRLFAPEVIQTSAMDCGPAALKCVLEGFGVHVSYGRLREACQTAVDGTSIDKLEEVAAQLGLEATQTMLPIEHVLLPEARVLPAVVVSRTSSGVTHFLVLWRTHGPLVQVMDPIMGRRWLRRETLLRQLYEHEMPVPAALWRAWAESEEASSALRRRLELLGADRGAARSAVETALAEPGWRGVAALDAACRSVESIVKAGSLKRGADAERVVAALHQHLAASDDDAEEIVPEHDWSVRRLDLDDEDEDEDEILMMRGAVALQLRYPGASPRPGDGAAVHADAGADDSATSGDERPSLPPELVAALSEPPARPGRELWRLLRGDGALPWAAVLLALLASAAGTAFEAVLLRSLLDLRDMLQSSWFKLMALLGVLGFLALVFLLDFSTTRFLQHAGRRLDTGLRMGLLGKLPRIALHYFRSRPTSDMAERSHAIHELRGLPPLGAQLVRAVGELIAIGIGISWLAPGAAITAWLLVGASVAIPFALLPIMMERDLRVRSIAGTTLRFYFDSLLGLMPVRAHGSERFVRAENDQLLVEWIGATRARQRAAILGEVLQVTISLVLAVVLIRQQIELAPDLGWALLLVFWTLSVPALGAEIGRLVRQYPPQRNITLRLLDLLGALEDGERAASPAASAPDSASRTGGARERGGVEVELAGVSVTAGGHEILENVSLRIGAGEHVAIVGASGAGKSSLVGLLLGWQRVSAGELRVDGEPLTEGRLAALRLQTAWVDPAVQIWNRSLIANVAYGARSTEGVTAAVETSSLRDVLRQLPDGMKTPLGESGGLVSGGQGQRVRLARALMRSDARLAILDEAFRGLDRRARAELLDRARQVWSRATLLCVTHDVTETLAFDRVLVVANGCVVEDGNPEELAKREETTYVQMLAAERELRAQLWGSDGWRRLWLEHGTIALRPEGGQR